MDGHKTKQNLINAELSPIKHFGQNFLISEEIIEKIIYSAKIKIGETILEIGPGTGNLTKALLDKGAKIIAVEKDWNLSKLLNSKLTAYTKPACRTGRASAGKQSINLKIINNDILRFDESTIKKPYRIIANIPYYLTGKLIQKFILSKNKPREMIIMVQKEVSERINAKPPKMNYLSAFTQSLARTEMLFFVGKECFWPIPKVDSAVIKIVPKNTEIDKNFDSFLKKAFKQPRQTFLNNLRHGNIKNANEIFSKMSFNKNIRAQNLSLEQLKEIFELTK